jgi:UDP-xylose/UDP-N-acetylglucosamine transporter B4
LTLPSQLSPSTTISFNPPKFNLSLLPRQIPLTTWLSYTLIFLLVNVLNNLAFSHDISVPVHIILRSGGSVTTMLVGYLVAGKSYTRTQVTGVLLLTAGVILAALSDAQAQGRIDASSPSPKNGRDTRSFTIGLLLLLVAQTLSAYMGLYIQQIYTALSSTSKPWRENLFYSHAIALPFFLPLYPSLASQFRALMNSPPLSAYLPEVSLPPSDLNTLALALEYLTKTPIKIVQLVLNALTQYACIRGVNVLSARSTALTVTIVLNVRKLVSLLLSIYIFGNTLAPGVLLGAVIVFVGGGVYGWGGGRKEQGGDGKGKETKGGIEEVEVEEEERGRGRANGWVGEERAKTEL